MKTSSYRDLLVWQKAMDLVQGVYNMAKQLPDAEKYGLSSQLRRAVVSIPSNIAEGYKRNSTAEYSQFCGIAAGSLAELETQIAVVARVYPDIDTKNLLEKSDEVQRMLYSMIRKLREAKTVR